MIWWNIKQFDDESKSDSEISSPPLVAISMIFHAKLQTADNGDSYTSLVEIPEMIATSRTIFCSPGRFPSRCALNFGVKQLSELQRDCAILSLLEDTATRISLPITCSVLQSPLFYY